MLQMFRRGEARIEMQLAAAREEAGRNRPAFFDAYFNAASAAS
ncbi:hypothetical protein [Caballeronia sp. dw_19]|nr:hypothetical protein [Caballeronia sp. dw_19]